MLHLAGSLHPFATAVDQLDSDPYLFNVRNGTLDLRTGQLRPHNPDDLITKIAGCGYEPDATSTTFDKFLADVLPDEEVRRFVARILGHALVGKVVEHLLAIFTGTGANGKSTIIETAMAVLGDYAIAVEHDLLVEHSGTSVHTTGQADLLGVRLAVCSETDDGRRLAAATVKRLTGGDKIRARRMRQDNIQFAPSHTVVMVTNHKPTVAGDDPALWRRLRIVPFDVIIPDQDQDRTLKEKLALELPAVLAWIVNGHADWHRNGLAEPAAVTTATATYQASSDVLGRFFDEHIMLTEFGTVRARELFGVVGLVPHQRRAVRHREQLRHGDGPTRRPCKVKRNGVMTYLGVPSPDTMEGSP